MKMKILPGLVLLVLILTAPAIAIAQNTKELYINEIGGNDENSGTREHPLKTLNEAADRINRANGTGAITVFIAEGIYGLDATATFHPVNWHFTKEERLTIRAEVLPDDAEWNQGRMPVIVSTMPLDFNPNGRKDPIGGASYRIQIETN